MRYLKTISFLLIVVNVFAPAEAHSQEREQTPETPAAVRDVLYVRPFELDTGFLFTWVPERPMIDRGVIVVLSVDPRLVVPKNSAEPVLYAGDRVVERLNWGHQSGHVIAIIPGSFDVTSEPIWFGSPGLPGRVSRDQVRSELTTIRGTVEKISTSRAATITAPEIHAKDFAELLRGEVAELVLRFSPQESELAEKWRLPEARVTDDPAVPVTVDEGGGVQ